MNFTSIDFETATSLRTSICSMGICVVENNMVSFRKEFLIKPQPFEFNEYNIYIHKITPMAVRNAPTFNQLWDTVRPFVDNRLVVAHNAGFDVGAMRATLEMFSLEYPTFDYLDTVSLSQKAYPEMESHKLNRLCDELGIRFSHHHAMDDAYACAMVLLRIMDDYGLKNLDELREEFDINIGHVFPGCPEMGKGKKSGKRKVSHAQHA